ncbi:MAG: antibiotic biosynthesis monooxygenase family protein [Bacteroidia bacterium]
MIIRIVKLSFEPENIETFVKLFHDTKDTIKSFEGCSHLELLNDINNPNVYFTYSYWEDESFLNAYRNSDFFKDVWQQTKVLFNDKPQAWSVKRV